MRQKHPGQRHYRFRVFAILLASCALILCAAQGIFGYPFRKTIALAATTFHPVEGFAYAAPLTGTIFAEGSTIDVRKTIRRRQSFLSILATKDLGE
jgi:hypothetical protein